MLSKPILLNFKPIIKLKKDRTPVLWKVSHYVQKSSLMKYLLYICFLFIVGCNTKTGTFEKYVSQLESLKTPITLKTIQYPEKKVVVDNYDTALFEQYKLRQAESVYGKVYYDQTGAGIIYTVPADVAAPVLVTYNKEGKKIDSLSLFQNASGFGLESEVYERVIYLPSKTIKIIDSAVRWKLNKSGDDRIEGSESFTIDSSKYIIDNGGKIRKQK